MVAQLFEYSNIDVNLQNVNGETAFYIAEAYISASNGPGFVAGINATQGRGGKSSPICVVWRLHERELF